MQSLTIFSFFFGKFLEVLPDPSPCFVQRRWCTPVTIQAQKFLRSHGAQTLKIKSLNFPTQVVNQFWSIWKVFNSNFITVIFGSICNHNIFNRCSAYSKFQRLHLFSLWALLKRSEEWRLKVWMVQPSPCLQIKLMLNSLEHEPGRIIFEEDVNTYRTIN